jgi:hypothetical protein
MWRLAALALIVCAGCANEDSWWRDSALGEVGARLSGRLPYAPPMTTVSSPAFYPPAPAEAPAEGAAAAGGASGGKP